MNNSNQNNSLACSQVVALLSFYIDGKTSYQITNFIQAHLCKCKSCREKYEMMAKVFNSFHSAKEQLNEIEVQKSVPISSYGENFKEKMSAYLDSELTDEESLRFKKFAISNPPVRTELEGMYKVKNAINNSFEKTKNDFKNDFSRDIIVQLDIKEAIQMQEPILKVASIFIFLTVFLVISLIVIF